MAEINKKITKTYALYPPQIEWVKQEAERLSQAVGIPVSESEIICKMIDRRIRSSKKKDEVTSKIAQPTR